METKIKGLATLSLLLAAAVAMGILMVTQATDAAITTDTQSNLNTELAVVTSTASDTKDSPDNVTGDAPNIFSGWGQGPMEFGGRRGGPCGRFGMGIGGMGLIEVSDEYKTAVTTIMESDADVQQLLSDGYNVTRVMPIIKTVLDAEGNVATKATNATVVLEKDSSGLAVVSVDLSQDKVTQIVIYTKTVIEK